jgi:hypothetical protein
VVRRKVVSRQLTVHSSEEKGFIAQKPCDGEEILGLQTLLGMAGSRRGATEESKE